MRAEVGDRLHVHGRVVGRSDQTWEVIWVQGPNGVPPYLVRRGFGHEVFVFPGAGSSVDCGSAMSPRDFNRLAVFGTTIRRHAGELSSTPDRATSKPTLADAQWPIRSSMTAQVGSTRAADPHSFNDPCNYLG
jgi:hypothetical protein